MEIPDNVLTVVRRAVEQQRAKDGPLPWDHEGLELVVDNSAIKIAELEAELVDVAHNLNTTRDRVERLNAAIEIAKAYLSTAQNVPADQSTSGYVTNALEVLIKV